MTSPAHILDITHDVCPMTWVKVRLELDELAPGEELRIRVRQGESHFNVTSNARMQGHQVLDDAPDPANAEVRVVVVRRATA